MSDRLPPNSSEAEQGSLGSILQDPSKCLPICQERGLTPETFYDLRNGTIYGCMVEMHNRGELVDTITLQQRLKDKGALEQCGGLAYISALPDTTPSAANLTYYLDIVQEKALLRRMLQVCAETANLAYEFDGSMPEFLDKVERDILAVRPKRTSDDMPPVKELVRRAIDEIEATWARQGQTDGIPTGYADLDKYTGGLKPGEMTVIAAYPSVGKTAFAMNIAENVILNSGRKVGVFSLEMSSVSLIKRVLCSNARVSLRNISEGFMSEGDFPKLATAAGRISAAPIWLDDSSDMSIYQLRSKARRWKNENGIELLIVDYLQLLTAVGGSRKVQNREQEVAEISRGIKGISKELAIPVIIPSQLNDDGKLRESRAIGQDADNVWVLQDENPTEDETPQEVGEVTLRIVKNRNGPRFVKVPLTFRRSITRFESAAKVADEDVPGREPYND